MSKSTQSQRRLGARRRKSQEENERELQRSMASIRAIEQHQALTLERTDIWFEDVSDERVCIQVTIRNASQEPTPPTPVVIQAALLGAFVAWQPLVELTVPSIAPGQSHTLITEAVRPRPNVLGDISRTPPGTKPVALGGGDGRQRRSKAARIIDFLFRSAWTTGQGNVLDAPTLPADLMELLGNDKNPHWAGNINVFIGKQSVERHLARALRVYPGRTNVAMFFVGERPDAYQFRIEGADESWQMNLFASDDHALLGPDLDQAAPIRQTDWVELSGRQVMLLSMRPPEDCTSGSVDVHVSQWSTFQQAVVEFSFNTSAAGSGCHTI